MNETLHMMVRGRSLTIYQRGDALQELEKLEVENKKLREFVEKIEEATIIGMSKTELDILLKKALNY